MRCLMCVVVILAMTPLAWGQAVTGFTGGSEFDSYYGSVAGDVVGFRFTVTESLYVTDLGVWNADTNAAGAGLTIAHDVGIWDAQGVLIAQVLVDPTTGTVVGDWMYESITPIFLDPGILYTIGAIYYTADGDNYVSSASSMTTIPEVVFSNSVYPAAAELGFVYPTSDSASFGRFGPNFIVGTPQQDTDLAIYKTDGSCYVLPGDPITYTVTVSHVSGSDAMGAFVEDIFPFDVVGVTWTCTPSGMAACTPSGAGDITDTVNIPAGDSVVYLASGTVDPGATGLLVNIATVDAPPGMTDTDPSNNANSDFSALEMPVFCDGFESGDTFAWDAVSP